jgi:hypothetical protein
MNAYRWLTLSTAIVITMLEAWLFTGASASASQPAPAPTVVMVTAAAGDTR